MAATDIRKNLNLFVDGRGQAGKIDNFNAPKLSLITEDFRAGGMNTPLKLTMGQESLDTDFSLFAYDKKVIGLFGVAEGHNVAFTARELLESYNGDTAAVVHTMRGKITEFDPGTSKAGEIAPIKITMNLAYYKLTIGGEVIHEIDVENMIAVVNGADMLAAARGILGL